MTPNSQPANVKNELTKRKGESFAPRCKEFSTHGLSGARTDRIAESAKVNKALLYYYFKSKQGLYAAAVEKRGRAGWWRMRWLNSTQDILRENAAAIGTEPFRSHPDSAGVPKPDAAGDDAISQRQKRIDSPFCSKPLLPP